MADPDLQIKGMGLVAQKILSALQASVWSKYKEGRAGRPHKPLPWILHWNRFSLVNEISFQNFRRMIPPSSFFTEGREKAHTRQRPKRSQLIPVSLAWSMHRSIATPPPDGRLVHRRVTPPPPQAVCRRFHLYPWLKRVIRWARLGLRTSRSRVRVTHACALMWMHQLLFVDWKITFFFSWQVMMCFPEWRLALQAMWWCTWEITCRVCSVVQKILNTFILKLVVILLTKLLSR